MGCSARRAATSPDGSGRTSDRSCICAARGHARLLRLGQGRRPLAATLLLYDAQAALAAWAARTGSPYALPRPRRLARPWRRPVIRAILAQPPGRVAGRFKVTEQGEVILARYGTLRSPTATSNRYRGGAARGSGGVERPQSSGRRALRDARIWRSPPRRPTAARSRLTASPTSSRESPLSKSLPTRSRLAPVAPPGRTGHAQPRRPAGYPVGLRLDADPMQPPRLVRPRHRPGRER